MPARPPAMDPLSLHRGLAHFNSARLAISRRYTYHSLGALGVIELTAPTRVKRVSDGMRRQGLMIATSRHKEFS